VTIGIAEYFQNAMSTNRLQGDRIHQHEASRGERTERESIISIDPFQVEFQIGEITIDKIHSNTLLRENDQHQSKTIVQTSWLHKIIVRKKLMFIKLSHESKIQSKTNVMQFDDQNNIPTINEIQSAYKMFKYFKIYQQTTLSSHVN
jgi:hypothetical protein